MTGQHRGLFVTVDGLGGVGKTTTVKQLGRELAAQGYPVYVTTEPSHDSLGEIARHDTAVYAGHALACLVAADRYHHLVTEIRPKLAAGQIVLCDRYVPSSYVLQRRDGVPLAFIEDLNADADTPDLAVILTADAEVAAGRIARRGAHNRFEASEDASRIEVELYRDTVSRLAAHGYTLLVIDTTNASPQRVAADIAGRITALAGVHGVTPAAG